MTDDLIPPPSEWIRAASERATGRVCRACGAAVDAVEWSCRHCLAPWHVSPEVTGTFSGAPADAGERSSGPEKTTMRPDDVTAIRQRLADLQAREADNGPYHQAMWPYYEPDVSRLLDYITALESEVDAKQRYIDDEPW